MKSYPRLLCVLATAFVTSSLFGYSHGGHEAIWIMAQTRLKPAAKQHVTSCISGDDVPTAAVWADWIRLKEMNHVDAAEIAKVTGSGPFQGSNDWHFMNLPLNATSYSRAHSVSANDNDVVQGIEKCIKLLESPDTTPDKIVHRRALRFLIHLVGDIHQPLHVACGYYKLGVGDSAQMVMDVPEGNPQHLPHDRGGNHLSFGSNELHAVWDDDMVRRLKPSGPQLQDSKAIAQEVISGLNAPATWTTTGDYHKWPEKWAGESATAAKKAYDGILLTHAKLQSNDHSEIAKSQMDGFNEDSYIANHRDEERAQLVKAAGRLADLLNAIHWAN